MLDFLSNKRVSLSMHGESHIDVWRHPKFFRDSIVTTIVPTTFYERWSDIQDVRDVAEDGPVLGNLPKLKEDHPGPDEDFKLGEWDERDVVDDLSGKLLQTEFAKQSRTGELAEIHRRSLG